jgi:hypothetical protein
MSQRKGKLVAEALGLGKTLAGMPSESARPAMGPPCIHLRHGGYNLIGMPRLLAAGHSPSFAKTATILAEDPF